jgi:hypothetical protein
MESPIQVTPYWNLLFAIRLTELSQFALSLVALDLALVSLLDFHDVEALRIL